MLKGAWSNTLHRVGWDTTKAILATAAFIGSWILGGVVFSATGGFLIGIAILAPIVFFWGIIQAQADMYSDLAKQKREPIAPAVPETDYLATAKPDYDKWRHLEELELQTAAQLWSGERPGMGMGGAVRETFAMLRAAIQKGELTFIPGEPVHNPSARYVVRQMEQKNPTRKTKVTRTGLKAFAGIHGYDPEFLRDRTTEPR